MIWLTVNARSRSPTGIWEKSGRSFLDGCRSGSSGGALTLCAAPPRGAVTGRGYRTLKARSSAVLRDLRAGRHAGRSRTRGTSGVHTPCRGSERERARDPSVARPTRLSSLDRRRRILYVTPPHELAASACERLARMRPGCLRRAAEEPADTTDVPSVQVSAVDVLKLRPIAHGRGLGIPEILGAHRNEPHGDAVEIEWVEGTSTGLPAGASTVRTPWARGHHDAAAVD